MSTPTTVKRGGFARDIRTGAVVKVAEVGGRDLMVRPAYKSDGYWTAPANLEPATDPHPVTGRRFVALLLLMGVVCALSSGITRDLLGHGFGIWEALAYTAPASWIQLAILNAWTKTVRI